ncbi:MAG: response regulator transcription factor [Pseudomonadota bacterium]
MPATVVLADDHRLVREGLRSVLADASDIEVVGEAENGRDSIALVRRLKPSIIVMDVSMPDLNGIDATRKIVETGLETRVLALSGHRDEMFVKGMLQAGASGYLLKDCASEELLTAIRTLTGGGMHVSPAVASIVVADYLAHVAGTVTPKEAALSTREREVLQLIAEGLTTARIAERLNLSVKTVESHRAKVMDKVGVRNIAGLTKYAIRHGLTTIDG